MAEKRTWCVQGSERRPMKIENSAGAYRQRTTKMGDGKLEFSGKMYDKS